MAEKIARYYVAENNPDGGHFPGVGLRDLTEEEWAALPERVQKSVDASKMYHKAAPPGHVAAVPYESGVKPKEQEAEAVPAPPPTPPQARPSSSPQAPAPSAPKEGGK